MKNTTEKIFIIVAPGLENICAAQLQQLITEPLELDHGGITFSGNLNDIYRCNLWLRCASRVLVRMEEIKCRDFPTLYQKALRLPWGRFIRPDRKFSLRVTCHSSRLNHSDRIATTMANAIKKSLGCSNAGTDTSLPEQLIFVRFDNDNCTISIDSSGDLLHKRGYRQHSTSAPLRETLAAACLMSCNWNGNRPLHDPFCGSGTIAIEAAMIAANIAPGLQRQFSFMHWPGYRHGLWNSLISMAKKEIQTDVAVTISGSDTDSSAIHAAISNATAAGVDHFIRFSMQDAFAAAPAASGGFMLCNPPYGERLHSNHSPAQLLTQLKKLITTYPHSWEGAALLPDSASNKTAIATFSNGGLAVKLYKL